MLCSPPSVWTKAEQRAWQLPERLTPSEWVAKYRHLSERESPAEPGQWNRDRVPYLNDVMDICAEPDVEQVTVIKTPQTGFSECFRCYLAWLIDEDPSPVLIVFPDEDSMKEAITDRIQVMINHNDRLSRHRTGRPRDEKTAVIKLQTMTIYTGSANSAQSLASRPVRVVILDEVGKYPSFTGKEASPIKLAYHRTTTFKDRRLVIVLSTPTVEESLEWLEWERAGDKRLYYVPCPHCGEYQTLDWPNVQWCKPAEVERIVHEHAGGPLDELQAHLESAGLDVEIDDLESDPELTMENLRLPDPDDKAAVAEWVHNERLAWMNCPHCGDRIRDVHKHRMLVKGRWLSKGQSIDREGEITGARPRSKHVAFRIWSPLLAMGRVRGGRRRLHPRNRRPCRHDGLPERSPGPSRSSNR